MLPFIWTTLVALLQSCSMVRTRFATILYFRLVTHKTACHSLSRPFLKLMMTQFRFCQCSKFLFTQNSKVEDLFCGASSGSELIFSFSNYFFSLGFKPIQDDFQHGFARMTDGDDRSGRPVSCPF